jgi:hypothetical protein
MIQILLTFLLFLTVLLIPLAVIGADQPIDQPRPQSPRPGSDRR